MEYLTNSSNIHDLFEYNKNSKEHEIYEKYLKYFYQLPSKDDKYERIVKDDKFILTDIKNPSKKIIIESAKYINLFDLYKNLKYYNEIILEKIALLVEKPSNIDDNDRNYFNELKNNYTIYNKKIQEIDIINSEHLEKIQELTIKKIDNSLLIAKYYNERNLIFKSIETIIEKESKNEIIKLFHSTGNRIPEQKVIDRTAKKLDIPSETVEKWLNWTEKCYQYLLAKNELYKTIQQMNEIKNEFIYKCENFIIKKPIIEN